MTGDQVTALPHLTASVRKHSELSVRLGSILVITLNLHAKLFHADRSETSDHSVIFVWQ